MPQHTHRCRAFTIVELLVVISIIAILLALLLPALGGAQRRGKKAEELSHLRQVGLAWNMYGNANNDAALPGFLEPDVQQEWKVTYRFPDNSKVPPAPNYTTGDNYAGPWTWRLAQYLDYSHKTLHGYSNEAVSGDLEMIDHAEEVAYEPAYGYNGYYIGGYWEVFEGLGDDGDVSRSAPVFNWARTRTDDRPLKVVSTRRSDIKRTADIILFCASSRYEQRSFLHNVEDGRAGWHFVDPPYLATRRIWGRSGPGSGGGQDVPPGTLEVFVDEGAPPLPRYTSNAAIVYADGHVGTQSPKSMIDMRMWMEPPDLVDESVFTFKEGIPSQHFSSRP